MATNVRREDWDATLDKCQGCGLRTDDAYFVKCEKDGCASRTLCDNCTLDCYCCDRRFHEECMVPSLNLTDAKGQKRLVCESCYGEELDEAADILETKIVGGEEGWAL